MKMSLNLLQLHIKYRRLFFSEHAVYKISSCPFAADIIAIIHVVFVEEKAVQISMQKQYGTGCRATRAEVKYVFVSNY